MKEPTSIKPPRSIKSFDQLMDWLETVRTDAFRELHTAIIEHAENGEIEDLDAAVGAHGAR